MATTQYNDPIAYNVARRYDGIFTPADGGGGADTSNVENRHAAVPWRNQRGRSNTYRRPSTGTTIVLPKREAPKPEVTVSRAETTILATPDRAVAEKAITDFVVDRVRRQEAQPELPAPKPEPLRVEPLPVETAGVQAAKRQESTHKRRQRDDQDVLELISMLEGF